MKKSLLLLFLFVFSGLLAQVTNQGNPLSWKLTQLRSVTPVLMAEINLSELMAEDYINDAKWDIPWRFGTEILVDINTNNSGVWDVLENGDRIWRLNILSPGANTLNFIFNDFYLPPGATLYLYNDEKTDLLGAYTSAQNRGDNFLGTWFVDGDNVWIEYFEPRSQRNNGRLQLSKVVHGYRSIPQNIANRGLNNSDVCNLDVNCSVGSDYDDIKDVIKHSVGLFIMGGSMCSGALINNANNDNAPYFLTANHCNLGNPATWAFRFNWISPNPVCASSQTSQNSNWNQTTSGATKLASNAKSDFMLLNIDSNLPTSWNLVWAGWTRSEVEIPEFTVGIHHPSGDIMKVCRDNRPPIRESFNFNGNESTAMWKVDSWDLGITEQGSSGSALFDQYGRIVGQLAGGTSMCVGASNNGGFDVYGRFDTSWNYGVTNDTRLSNWLDPNNTGLMNMGILNTPDFQFIGNISIYPNPAINVIYIMNNNSSQLNYELYAITGQRMSADQLPFANNEIAVHDLAEGVYFLKLFDGATNSSLVKRILIKK
jgi:lysyl endopeptidase